jgi:hypothetical protein
MPHITVVISCLRIVGGYFLLNARFALQLQSLMHISIVLLYIAIAYHPHTDTSVDSVFYDGSVGTAG